MNFTVYGVVAEFNPFHNGHEYLIKNIKKNGDTVIAVMSESFVQRGESACLRTRARVKAALMCGADIVFSLPVTCSVLSAEGFAFGGVSLLNSLGVVDCLVFGAETAEKEKLIKCAGIFAEPEFNGYLLCELEKGVSYPKARENALKLYSGEDFSDITEKPNNILAVEYIKALKKLKSNMDFCCVERTGENHDGNTENGEILSASHIREIMNNTGRITGVPDCAREIYENEIELKKAPADFKNTENAVLAFLRMQDKDYFLSLPDVGEGLENRLYEAVRNSASLSELYMNCKTKRYTYSRIKRLVLCAYLGITKDILKKQPPYIKVLGFNADGEKLFKEIKENSVLPVVTNFGDIKKLGESAEEFFGLESKARDLFSLTLPVPDVCGTLMTDKIVKLR